MPWGRSSGLGHTFTPVAAAILMTLLLALKVELRRFAGGVSMEELRGAVLLGLIGLVIYPILPIGSSTAGSCSTRSNRGSR